MSRRSTLRWLLGLAAEPALARVARAADPATKLKEGGAEIEVSFESEHFDLPQAALLGWVSQAARAVSAYYGRFPVPRARVRKYPEAGRADLRGRRAGRLAWDKLRRRRRVVPHLGGPPHDG